VEFVVYSFLKLKVMYICEESNLMTSEGFLINILSTAIWNSTLIFAVKISYPFHYGGGIDKSVPDIFQ
jgi:hypothetical protein